ncbi:MAG: phage protease [Methylobacter sp.]|nr:phage protease [Methylobacter sp.]MDP2099829.1 phage protease [Methylobacter sp.]MDP2427949.1 phage protease [Methylobacter sp.]MDP3054209.1 phage protease [Methylobacter sp.]MDP3361124.1 phage protease [Methylobacter sp.]
MPKPTTLVALSALLVDLASGAPSEIKLIPAGSFRSARDARPVDVKSWLMDEADADAVLSAQAALKGKFLVDYDHQTLRAEKNGQPAPAAGWGGRLEWRPGDGLYAVDMDWTPAALSAIAAKEYRYISPVFLYDKQSGAVTSVKMAALTNYPALDDLTDLAAAAALIYSTPQDDTMDKELLAALCAVLGLASTATVADIAPALAAVKTQLTAADGTVTALSAALAAKDQELVALSALVAAAPDMSKYMPVEVVLSLQTQLAALSATSAEVDRDKLIADNIRKLPTPELQNWAAGQPLAVLSAYLEKAPEIVPRGMQTGGIAPVIDTGGAHLTADELAVCSAMGVDPDEFKLTKGAN